MEKKILATQKTNINTIMDAFKHDRVVFVDCIDLRTEQHTAVLCVVNPSQHHDDKLELVPLAQVFNGNPYEYLISPIDPSYDEIVARIGG